MALLNGGFEAWTAGSPDSWTPNPGAGSTITQETVIKHGGASSAKFVSTGNGVELSQIGPVVPGSLYTIGYWFQTVAGQFPFMRASIVGGPSANFWCQFSTDQSWAAGFDQAVGTPGTGAFAQVFFTTKAIPAGATGVVIDFGGPASQTMYVDDAFLDVVASGVNHKGLSLLGVG